MSLRDFRPDESMLDDEIPSETQPETGIKSSRYQEEINTLKIDKLSNRITIISVILPCIIGAIIVFAYLDMKERVVDVDETKSTQVERITKLLDEKLNALDVKIAKNRFDLEKALPELSGKQVALEGRLAKISSSKADDQKIRAELKKVNQAITRQEKIIASAMAENKKLLGNTSKQIKDEINLFKEEFDARLLELSQYQEQIAELGKSSSLLDKKVRNLEMEIKSVSTVKVEFDQLKTQIENRINALDSNLQKLDKQLNTNFSRLQKDVDLLIKKSTSPGPQPQINLDTNSTGDIESETLTQ